MPSAFKNLALMFLGSLLGAATILGYLGLQPAATRAAATTRAPAQNLSAQTGAPGSSDDAVVQIYQRLSPSVVNITSSRRSPAPGSGESSGRGIGSGLIIDQEGHIVTNDHMVSDGDTVEVTLLDGTRLPATLLGRDLGNDLAVIQVRADAVVRSRIVAAPLGDSDRVKPGQVAIAIGNPFGFQGSITRGIVSAVGRTYSSEVGHTIRDMIQTDAAINPGNSGGPLINAEGEVIGINTAIESPVRGFVGVGFAVPANTVRRSLQEMLAGKTVSHPWLGLYGMAVDQDLADMAHLTIAAGVYVVHVLPGSPAAQAGIRAAVATHAASGTSVDTIPSGGDVLTLVDGRPLLTPDDLTAYVDSKRVGDTITLSLVRDAKPIDLQVTLAPSPSS